MASNIVDLIIRARDNASSTIKGVAGATGSLSNSIAGGIIKANLFGAVLDGISNAASTMMGKFEEAKGIEIGDVSAASTFSALTGKSFEESTKFVSDFSKEISKVAGALPGATNDYNTVANSIMDNVIPAFKDANGVLKQGDFQQNLLDITKKMTLMGVTTGTNAQAVGMFTARLLDGNIASAKQLLFADNNPGFMNRLEQAMAERGKKLDDFKELSNLERIKIVQAVSSEFIQDKVIDAASNTVEGLTAGIESSLFDPKSGVFGLLRDLSGAEGNQTVMTAVAGSIKAMMGFFDAGASILNALGIPSIDPMLEVYNGINTFTGWINQASGVAKLIARTISGTGGGIAGFQIAVEKFFDPKRLIAGVDYLFNIAGSWINQGFESIAQITSSLFAGGKGMIGGFVVGEKIGAFVGDFLGKIATFIINLPWGNILVSIGDITLMLGSAIVGALWGLQSQSIEVTRSLMGQIGSGIVTAMSDLGLATSYTLKEWGSYFFGGWAEVGMFGIDSAKNFFAQLWQGINDMWNQLIQAITQAIGGFIDQAKNTITAPVNAVTSIANDPLGAAGNAIQNVGQSAFNFGQNLASGLMGNSSGATPAIVPNDVSRLSQASVSNSKTANTTFAPTFNVSGVNDPTAIASMAIDQLDAMFRQRQEAILAP